jgi:hypothetical protein
MRVEGWEGLLYEHIHQSHAAEFEWGQNDCALWSADWVFKATEKDFGAAWRGHYASEEELQTLLNERGYSGAADIANEHLAAVPIAFAQRGDIVQHPMGYLGICDGVLSYFIMTEGITRLHTHRCIGAWKVE